MTVEELYDKLELFIENDQGDEEVTTLLGEYTISRVLYDEEQEVVILS